MTFAYQKPLLRARLRELRRKVLRLNLRDVRRRVEVKLSFGPEDTRLRLWLGGEIFEWSAPGGLRWRTVATLRLPPMAHASIYRDRSPGGWIVEWESEAVRAWRRRRGA